MFTNQDHHFPQHHIVYECGLCNRSYWHMLIQTRLVLLLSLLVHERVLSHVSTFSLKPINEVKSVNLSVALKWSLFHHNQSTPRFFAHHTTHPKAMLLLTTVHSSAPMYSKSYFPLGGRGAELLSSFPAPCCAVFEASLRRAMRSEPRPRVVPIHVSWLHFCKCCHWMFTKKLHTWSTFTHTWPHAKFSHLSQHTSQQLTLRYFLSASSTVWSLS